MEILRENEILNVSNQNVTYMLGIVKEGTNKELHTDSLMDLERKHQRLPLVGWVFFFSLFGSFEGPATQLPNKFHMETYS